MRLTEQQIEKVRSILRRHDARLALQWELAVSRRISGSELAGFLASHRSDGQSEHEAALERETELAA